MVRRRLFARLQRICEQKGEAPLLIVAQVLEEAAGPKIRDKGKYFSFAVVRRLTEAGFWAADAPPVNQTREQVQDLAAKRAAIGRPAEDQGGAQQITEMERLRLSNELLKRQLAAVRKPLEGGAW